MEMKPILDALERLYSQKDARIVFWHDPAKEFAEFMTGRMLPLEIGSHSVTVVSWFNCPRLIR